MWASYPASSCPFALIRWSEISFLEGKWISLRGSWMHTHIYKNTWTILERPNKSYTIWDFVIAVWGAKASVYILRSKRSIDKTSCVYLTHTTHVQPVWRSMRWDVWYNTHVEMYINHLKNSKMWNDWYGTHTSVSHMPPWCLLRHMQKST